MKFSEDTIYCMFERALHCECLSQVLVALQECNITLTRNELIQILQNHKHREKAIAGSQFDLVQQKIRAEQEIEQLLMQAKAKKLSWREAVFQCHISPGPDYRRLQQLYEKM